MKRKILCKAVFYLLFLFVMTGSAMSADITWLTDYNKALEQAKSKSKFVIIDFYTDWCGWCHRLEEEAFSDQEIIGIINKHFIPLRIDGDKQTSIVNKYQVRGYPTILFIDSEGKELDRIGGYVNATTFLSIISRQVEGTSLGALQQKYTDDPNNISNALEYANLLVEKGQINSANTIFKQILSNPNATKQQSNEANFGLALAHLAAKNYGTAVDILKKLVGNPYAGNMEAKYMFYLAISYYYNNNKQQALDILISLNNKYPDSQYKKDVNNLIPYIKKELN